MRKGFALVVTLAIGVGVIAAVAIGVGISTIVYNKLNPTTKVPYNPELSRQLEEKYSHLPPELQRKILNNEELTEDEHKELLKFQLGEEEVNKIQNKADDQKAQANLSSVITEVEACLVGNQYDGLPIEKTYTVNGGCADYKYFEKSGGIIENEVRERVTMYANLEDQLICIWA